MLHLEQHDIWTYMYDGEAYVNYKAYTDKRNFIQVNLTEKLTALLFVGWPYNSEPSLLTIVLLTKSGDARVVYNKLSDINYMDKGENCLNITLQNQIQEIGASGKPEGDRDIHHITFEDGIMYYK